MPMSSIACLLMAAVPTASCLWRHVFDVVSMNAVVSIVLRLWPRVYGVVFVDLSGCSPSSYGNVA